MSTPRAPRRGVSKPGTNRGSFRTGERPEADIALTENPPAPEPAPPPMPGRPVPTPPPVSTSLTRPVACRKCQGTGIFTYVSGGIGSCAPCSGTGQVEGDAATRAARKAREKATLDFYAAAREHSYVAAEAVNMLREKEPERYERALGSFLNSHPGLMDALEAHHLERRLSSSPRARLMHEAKAWRPPVPDLDTREGSFDQCKNVSALFTRHMRELGYEATWIQVVGMERDCPDADPRWLSMPQDRWSHYATVVTIPSPETDSETSPDAPADPSPDNTIVFDWTLRQFDPNAAYPFAGSERLYGAFFTDRYGISDRGLTHHLATIG